MLIGTLSLALFNASKDQVARNFAYVYAAISVGVLVRVYFDSFQRSVVQTLAIQIYGYAVYQRRITMIRKRDPGNFGG